MNVCRTWEFKKCFQQYYKSRLKSLTCKVLSNTLSFCLFNVGRQKAADYSDIGFKYDCDAAIDLKTVV